MNKGIGRPLLIFYILVSYVLLQFSWWAWLLVDLNTEIVHQREYISELKNDAALQQEHAAFEKEKKKRRQQKEGDDFFDVPLEANLHLLGQIGKSWNPQRRKLDEKGRARARQHAGRHPTRGHHDEGEK